MKKRDYNLFIKDIVDAMEHIEEFAGDMTLNELEADEKTSSAVIRKFEVIGEAVKHIPYNFRRTFFPHKIFPRNLRQPTSFRADKFCRAEKMLG